MGADQALLLPPGEWGPEHDAGLGIVRGPYLGSLAEGEEDGDQLAYDSFSMSEGIKKGKMKRHIDDIGGRPLEKDRKFDTVSEGSETEGQIDLEAEKSGEPVVVAIADFDPPRESETQMLGF